MSVAPKIRKYRKYKSKVGKTKKLIIEHYIMLKYTSRRIHLF